MREVGRAVSVLALQTVALTGLMLAQSGGLCVHAGQCSPRAYAVAAADVGFVFLAAGALGLLGAGELGQGAHLPVAHSPNYQNIFQRMTPYLTGARGRMRFVLAVIAGGLLALSVGLALLASLGG